MSEAAIWIGRILHVLPELVGLWNAAKTNDTNAELDAQLALTRKIKDRQTREEIEGA